MDIKKFLRDDEKAIREFVEREYWLTDRKQLEQQLDKHFGESWRFHEREIFGLHRSKRRR